MKMTEKKRQAQKDDIVNLMLEDNRSQAFKELSTTLPEIILNQRQMCDFELLSTGVFSPLTGFMKQIDYESVLDRMRLESGQLWPIPICLDIHENVAETIEIGQSVALKDPEGFLLGILNVEDLWLIDKEKEANSIFGTTDSSHPGVDYLLNRSGSHYIGGEIFALNLPIHPDFKNIRNTPAETQKAFEKVGWRKVIGFYTRQPIHRPQFEMTIQAMEKSKANLLILPIDGLTRPEDFDHFTRMRCYKEVLKYYPPDACMINLLPLSMRMAGPREALLHLMIGKNYGCTHFVIGHNHASPGNGLNGDAFYETNGAKRIAEQFCKEIGISVITFEEMVYHPFEDEFIAKDKTDEKDETISFSGADIQKRIRSGKKIPSWATFPEVIHELKKSYPPPQNQGFTIFCTGLSGAGKSTIAKILYAKFLEIGTRPVTLLDGDIVRRNLSSELNFSKEHRDINVKRIGFVAQEITKNRGIAICAPIAPYESTRAKIRHSIETHGGFFEVHVSTPIVECEKRDRKGMYAKARAGLIKDFTGVDDPYEAPSNPELRIDTTNLTPNEAAQEVMIFIKKAGFL